MYVETIDSIKEIIQKWAKENHSGLRVGWGGPASCPSWVITRFALPNPQLIGQIQFREIASLSWPLARYIDELQRAVEDLLANNR